MENTVIYFIITALAGLLPGLLVALLIKQKAAKKLNELKDLAEEERSRNAKISERLAEMEKMQQAENSKYATRIQNMNHEIGVLKNENEMLVTHNRELDQLLKEGQPVIHSLKMKLIEANNTIVRYKARLGLKD